MNGAPNPTIWSGAARSAEAKFMSPFGKACPKRDAGVPPYRLLAVHREVRLAAHSKDRTQVMRTAAKKWRAQPTCATIGVSR